MKERALVESFVSCECVSAGAWMADGDEREGMGKTLKRKMEREEVKEMDAVVWPATITLPEGEMDAVRVRSLWEAQPLAFHTASDVACDIPEGGEGAELTRYCLVQPANGPCGLLAALQTHIIQVLNDGNAAAAAAAADGMENGGNDVLMGGLASVLRTVADAGEKKEGVEVEVVVDVRTMETVRGEDAKAVVREAREMRGAGMGAVELLYSAVLTRGVEQVGRDLGREGDSPYATLIVGENGFCSQSLVQLLLTGVAIDPVSHPDSVEERAPRGFLTYMEADSSVYARGSGNTGFAVPPLLKFPTRGIWVVHGGDHYSIVWTHNTLPIKPTADHDDDHAADHADDHADDHAADHDDDHTADHATNHTRLEFLHYNGLKPGGPRIASITVDIPPSSTSSSTSSSIPLDPSAAAPIPGIDGGTVEIGATRNVAMVVRRVEHDNQFFFEVALDKPVLSLPEPPSSSSSSTETESSSAADVQGYCIQGCGFFGSPGQSGMCSACWRKSEFTPISLSVTTLCAEHGCSRWGLPELEALCPLCFAQATPTTTTNADPDPDPNADADSNGVAASVEPVEMADSSLPPPSSPWQRWRCRDCVLKQQYMFNTPGVPQCDTCSMPIAHSRRTVYVTYDMLPKLAKEEVDLEYSPRMTTLLRSLLSHLHDQLQITYNGTPPSL